MGQDVTLYCYAYDRDRCFPDILAGVPVRSVREINASNRVPQSTEAGLARHRAQLRRYFREAPKIADLIDPRTTIVNPHEWLAHRAAALFSRRSAVPVVWTFNDPSGWHLIHGWGPRALPYRIFEAIDTPQVHRFAAVATLSHKVEDIAKRSYRSDVRLVRCGIDVDAIATTPAVSHPTDAPLHVLSVGFAAPWRRYEDSIDAILMANASGFPCHLEIIGSDRFTPEYAQQLRNKVAEGNTARFVTLRFESVSDEELQSAFGRADIALFANDEQAWGLAQLESMARRIPTIISRGAGVSEVLVDGRDCILVDVRSPRQISDALIRLGTSPALREQLAAQGQRRVLSEFTSEHYAGEMLGLFREVLASRSSR
jgi:glycosyltransferase involved in cell wall biosynthesis